MPHDARGLHHGLLGGLSRKRGCDTTCWYETTCGGTVVIIVVGGGGGGGALVRTAFDDEEGGAHSSRDANFITFRPWPAFRRLTKEDGLAVP